MIVVVVLKIAGVRSGLDVILFGYERLVRFGSRRGLEAQAESTRHHNAEENLDSQLPLLPPRVSSLTNARDTSATLVRFKSCVYNFRTQYSLWEEPTEQVRGPHLLSLIWLSNLDQQAARQSHLNNRRRL